MLTCLCVTWTLPDSGNSFYLTLPRGGLKSKRPAPPASLVTRYRRATWGWPVDALALVLQAGGGNRVRDAGAPSGGGQWPHPVSAEQRSPGFGVQG